MNEHVNRFKSDQVKQVYFVERFKMDLNFFWGFRVLNYIHEITFSLVNSLRKCEMPRILIKANSNDKLKFIKIDLKSSKMAHKFSNKCYF